VPPALVARLPPIVQLPSAARLSGNRNPACSAAALQVLQNAAGFGGDGQIGRIDGAHCVHALQAQHDLLARCVGHGADGQAGVAALRHQADASGGAGLDDGGHFGGAGRAHDGQRLALGALAPVAGVGAQVAVGQHMGGAGDLAKPLE